MCTNKNYAYMIKKQYDAKYHLTGKRSKPIFVGSVKKVQNGDIDLFSKLPRAEATSGKYDLIMLSCGQCKECRLKKIKEVAIQSTCEAQYWDKFGNGNSFITLTFGDEATYSYLRSVRKMSRYKAKKYRDFLTWSLESREFQLFMKRLRKEVKKYYPSLYDNLDRNLRVLHCGEYGENNNRPHHHAIIFNFNFPDAYYWSTDKSTGEKYYRSPLLERCWPFGISLLTGCTYNTCSYVAGYVMKKINGHQQESHYNGRKPEFRTSSNRPGLGFDWFMKFGKSDVLPTDSVNLRNWKGKKVLGRPPKYFDKIVNDIDPDYMELVKDLRKMSMKDDITVNNPDNWLARDIIATRMQEQLAHTFEFVNEGDIDKDEYYKKGGAFGVSRATLDSDKEGSEKYLSTKSYKDYEFKSKNYDESRYRQRMKKYFNFLTFDRLEKSDIITPNILLDNDDLDWVYAHIEGSEKSPAPC